MAFPIQYRIIATDQTLTDSKQSNKSTHQSPTAELVAVSLNSLDQYFQTFGFFFSFCFKYNFSSRFVVYYYFVLVD